MLPRDIETGDALRHLSWIDRSAGALSRRRVLQAAASGIGGAALAALLPGPLGAAVAGAVESARPDEPILVVVTLSGGNDGLNTVVPYTDGTYRARRGALALGADRVRRLDDAVGLHPNLGFLAGEWAAGLLAVVEGVGYANPDFSHFSSMATWMQAWGAAAPAVPTGWVGRYLDGLDGALFRSVVIGTSVPLAYQGLQRRATAVGASGSEFGTRTDPVYARVYDAVRDLAAAPTGRGAWADALAAVDVDLLDVARTVAPRYQPALPSEAVVRDFTFGARLLEAGLGIRVLGLDIGDFDSHADQQSMHDARMAQLDAGLQALFATLSPAVAARTTVVTVSEFGRTLGANESGGTDHGAASSLFVLGPGVRGGRYGAPPSLTALDRDGQLVATLDFRSVLASLLEGWLGADADGLLGRRYERLTGLWRDRPAPAPSPSAPDRPRPAGFVPITPERRLDTRDGTGEVPVGPIAAAGTLLLTVAGRGSVPPTGASAVALNVTVTEPTAAGYLTVWPAGEERPVASNLNFVPGQTVPNYVVAKLGADGRIALFNSAGRSHVVADVVGYFADDVTVGLVPLAPSRLLDTREGRVPLGPGGVLELPVTGRGGVPDEGAGAVVLNLTVTEPSAAGYLTVWPTGDPMPLASSLNFVPGDTVPNLVVAKVGAGGRVSLYNSAGTTHVVADVVGFYGPLERRADAVRAVALSPARLLDTRPATALGPGEERRLVVAGAGGVPATGVRGVSLNVTVTEPTAPGYLTVYPSGAARPLASNLNFRPGRTVPNAVVPKVGDDGAVTLYNSAGRTHVVVDVVGYFAAAS